MPSGRECIANGLFSEPFEVTAEGGKHKGRPVKRSTCQRKGCRYKQNKRQCLGYIEVDAEMKDANKTLMKYIKDHVAGHEEQVRKDAVEGAPTPPLSVVAVAVGVLHDASTRCHRAIVSHAMDGSAAPPCSARSQRCWA